MGLFFLVALAIVIPITISLHVLKLTKSHRLLLEAVGISAFVWVLIGLGLDILTFLMG